MATCSDCKHWGLKEDGGWDAEAVGFKPCAAVRERWTIQDEAADRSKTWGDDSDRWIEHRKEALKASRAYVQDGSEYHAQLVTGPDFFCALHEVKE